MTYLERLQQSQEERDAQQLGFLNEENRLQIQSDLLETRRSVSAANRELDDMLRADKLNYSAIITKKSDIKALEDGITALEALQTELFPVESE